MTDFLPKRDKKQFKLAQFKRVEEIVSQTLTLESVSLKESMFGTGLYIRAVINDTEQPIIITTSSKALMMQLQPLIDSDDGVSLQFSIEPRGNSFEVKLYD